MRVFDIVFGIGMSISVLASAAAPMAQSQIRNEAPRAGIPPSLADSTPRTLVTMAVIGTDGETIGRVESVARNRQTQLLEFVIKTEGGERLALRVDRLQAIDGQLRLTSPLSKDELQQRLAAFDPDDFTATAKDTELARLAELPPTG